MRIFYEIHVRDINKLLIGLIIFELFLVTAYILGLVTGHPTDFFNLDGEGNLQSWFSSTQYLVIGFIFLFKSQQHNTTRTPSRLFFILLCSGFIFLSVDEGARIHETLNGVLKHVNWLPRFKMGNGIWIFIYALIGFTFYVKTFRDILALWNRYRRPTKLMVLGFAILVFGAVGLEILGYQFLKTGFTPSLERLEVTAEEFLEMFGVSVILYGALLLLIDKPAVDS